MKNKPALKRQRSDKYSWERQKFLRLAGIRVSRSLLRLRSEALVGKALSLGGQEGSKPLCRLFLLIFAA